MRKNDHGEWAIGVDLGGTNLRAALVNRQGNVLSRKRGSTEAQTGPEAVIQKIGALAKGLLREQNLAIPNLRGVGVGAPGPLDPKKGEIYYAPNLSGWSHVPLKKLLETELGGYVQVENDANAAALAEYRFGAGRGTRSMVCLTLGTGVGGGIILRGKVWRGATYAAGEIGHMTIERDGPLCGCGNRGCLEALASASGLISRVKSLIGKGEASPRLYGLAEQGADITPRLLYEEALQGDAFCKEMLAETGTYLGIGLTNIIHILNPEAIVLAGGLIGAGPFLLEAALAEVQRRAFPWAAQATRILVGELGDDAGVLGAAALVL